MSDPLEPLARRVHDDQLFLASLLTLYARSEELDEAGVAAAVGCRPDALTDLRLCRAPRADAPDFQTDVTRIAEHFGLDPQRLAAVARRGQALQRARHLARGTLLAARDAAPGDSPDEPGDPP